MSKYTIGQKLMAVKDIFLGPKAGEIVTLFNSVWTDPFNPYWMYDMENGESDWSYEYGLDTLFIPILAYSAGDRIQAREDVCPSIPRGLQLKLLDIPVYRLDEGGPAQACLFAEDEFGSRKYILAEELLTKFVNLSKPGPTPISALTPMGPRVPSWLPTAGEEASVAKKVCECGAEKHRWGHSPWCPKAP